MTKSAAPRIRQGDLTRAARGVRAAGIESFDLVCTPEGLIIRVTAGAATGAEAAIADELKKWSRRGS